MSLSINPDLTGPQDSSRLQQLWEVALLGTGGSPTSPANVVSDDAVVPTVSVSLVGGARSAHDGLAIVQTADNAFGDVASLLRRMDQIAMVCGATAALSPIAQTALQNKFQELQVEVQRIQAAASWKGVDVLAGRDLTFKDGPGADDNVTIAGATTLSPVDVSQATTADPSRVQAAVDAVNSKRADLAAVRDRLSNGLRGFGTSVESTPSITHTVAPADANPSGGLSLLL
jgi:flagellin